jgi:hypothetical protein
MVQTAKHAAKAEVLIQSARPAPAEDSVADVFTPQPFPIKNPQIIRSSGASQHVLPWRRLMSSQFNRKCERLKGEHWEAVLEHPTLKPPPSRWSKILEVVLRPQIRAWRGEAPLALTFWGHGVFVSLIQILAYIDALYRHAETLQQGLLTVFMLYTGWVLVAIWRCAARTAQPWGTIAQLATITWAGNALLVAGFLQLDLLFG